MAILEARFEDAHYQYERLRRTNVLNVAFPIWYDGHIGVINGLHLGRLPTNPVSTILTNQKSVEQMQLKALLPFGVDFMARDKWGFGSVCHACYMPC